MALLITRLFNIPLLALLIVATFTLLTGCATPTSAPPAEVKEMVWPPPPEQARIRYLGDLQSLDDVAGDKQQSIRDLLMGEEKTDKPSLVKPYGVHSDSKGRVFVADTGIAGLVVFDLKQKNVSFWGTDGLGTLSKPVGVTSDTAGNVYVSDVGTHRVVVYDVDGNYRNAFGGPEVLSSPVGMVFNNASQRLYVVDSKRSQIVVFNPQGTVVNTIGELGGEPGNFNTPTNIAIDASGRLYVADTLNFRVQVLEPDGAVVNAFGEVGDRPGNFNRLKGIGVDNEGHIYTIDASFNNFQIYDPQGTLLLVVGSSGTGPGGFYLPAGAHVDNNNRIFIADQYNRRIQMFEFLPESVTE